MRTDDLIAALAADARPVVRGRAERRFAASVLVAPVVVLALMLVALGTRPDLATAATLPMFWAKLAAPAVVALATACLLLRLGHPGARVGHWPVLALAPMVLLFAVGMVVLWRAAPAERLPLVMGQTWRECLFNVGLLSLPALLLAFAAARQLAPTRPALAGGVAGLFAGTVAGAAYAFHCPELEAPFLAVWYLGAMLLPAAAGAFLGRRWLRW